MHSTTCLVPHSGFFLTCSGAVCAARGPVGSAACHCWLHRPMPATRYNSHQPCTSYQGHAPARGSIVLHRLQRRSRRCVQSSRPAPAPLGPPLASGAHCGSCASVLPCLSKKRSSPRKTFCEYRPQSPAVPEGLLAQEEAPLTLSPKAANSACTSNSSGFQSVNLRLDRIANRRSLHYIGNSAASDGE
jgi:hypothetical protein